MDKATYIVTVDENHRDSLGAVAKRLKAAGMDIHNELQSIGAITGSIEPEKASEISQVEGVSQVSQSGQLRAI